MTDDAYGAVAETHSGVVFFLGDRALKVKKPVDLGFLDFTTLERRRLACEREVLLNRRLAPDVYEGVGTITGPAGDVREHVVHMRRLPADRRLSLLVAAGADGLDHEVRHIASVLAAFHAGADASAVIDDNAGPARLRSRWVAELDGIEPYVGDVVDAETATRVRELALAYVDGRHPLLAERVADGRARDGHGDLLADDIFCLDDGPRILDCLDFDDRLRWDDVLADVAFLAMDLERLGRPDLATLLLDEHEHLLGDSWPASLGHHHIAYRAHVRAKVACIRHGQGDPDAAASARLHLDLCLRHLEAARVRLVVVGGLPGTGKSTLAAGLAADLGAVHLRTDELRKERAGLEVTARAVAPFETGLYDPEITDATYRELLGRARTSLGRGESVVLDGSWQRAAWRRLAAAVAVDTSSELAMFRCDAPFAVTSDRMRHRLEVGADPSDATPDVARAMAERFEAWPDAVAIDTSSTPAASRVQARAAMATTRVPTVDR